MRQSQVKKTEVDFKLLLFKAGCSEEAAGEFWKWYNPAKKKGVASF
jgi:hypothetical protein